MTKLKDTEKLILSKSKVQTLLIQADFDNGDDIEMISDIANKVKDLDLSLVFNNAALDYLGNFVDMDTKFMH